MKTIKEGKTSIRLEIGYLLDHKCRGCLKVKKLKKGSHSEMEYCAFQCEIGRKLRDLGSLLEKGPQNTTREESKC
jgi:hypothetical protein